MSSSRNIEREALAWLARINDPEFEAWDAWEAWLAMNPEHAETYWRIAAAEADVVASLGDRPPARTRRATRRPPAIRWAAVAAVLAAGALAVGWLSRPAGWTAETAPGQRRLVALADGTQLHLDGATSVRLDRRRPRRARLERGRMLVEVAHDPQAPFVVHVADAVVTDLGTVFDVTRLETGLRVAVSEGQVQVERGRREVILRPGEAVHSGPDGALARSEVAPSGVGAWRRSRLVYRDEPLPAVAEDLSRALGRPVGVSPALGDRRFTGSLSTAGSPPELQRRLEVLLEVTVIEEGDGWRLEPRPAE